VRKRILQSLAVTASLSLHILALAWWLNRPVETPLVLGMAQEVVVSLIASPDQQTMQPVASTPQPVVETPPIEDMAVERKMVSKPRPPQPIKPVAASAVTDAATPVVAPAAEARAAAPVTAARYDADYLNNPAPHYPPMSRRLGEQGTALLRVQVAGDGTPLVVELKRSSGFERLDTAARSAAMVWRFVPARQGDAVLVSWVDVPVQFSLQK
jgi:protein TonB